MRLIPDQSSAIRRADEVTFFVDGKACRGRIGESVAMALLRGGRPLLRHAPVDGAARGMFCCMGLCQECAVMFDGAIAESCRLPVRDGMSVSTLTQPR